MLRSAALASMVEASTPMRSPLTRPASAIRARTQSKIAVWTSWAGARGSVTARNGPAHDPGFPAVETPVTTGNPSSAIPARAQSRCPRSSPPGACGNSAPAAPKAPPAWPRNRTDRPPRQSRRNRPRSVPTADGRKHMTRRARHLRPAYHQVPLTILLLSHRHQRIPRSNQNVKESDQAACVQCQLRQRAAKLQILK